MTTTARTLRDELTEHWTAVANRLIAQGTFPEGETIASFVRYWVNTDLATTRR